MKPKSHRHCYTKPLALTVTASCLLAGCLGGSSEDPFTPRPDTPTTPAVTAASCFDNALNYTVGNTIELDYTNYAINPTDMRPSRASIAVVSNTARFENQMNLLQIQDIRSSNLVDATNSWLTELNTYVLSSIPNTGIVTTVGTVSKTRHPQLAAPEMTVTTVYNPALKDERHTMELGKSLTQTLSGTIRRVSPATGDQTAVDTSTNFTTTRTITFVDKESLLIGSQNIETCRFSTSVVSQPDTTEWIYRGQTIRKEVGGALTEQVTTFTSSR